VGRACEAQYMKQCQGQTVKGQGHNSSGLGPTFRLQNDLYCVGWGVKLYPLTHSGPYALVYHLKPK